MQLQKRPTCRPLRLHRPAPHTDRDAGIEPMVTLFHWDLPQALQDAYGGFNDSTRLVKDFVYYADVAFSHLGPLMRGGRWITFNEPLVTCDMGFKAGDLRLSRTASGQAVGAAVRADALARKTKNSLHKDATARLQACSLRAGRLATRALSAAATCTCWHTRARCSYTGKSMLRPREASSQSRCVHAGCRTRGWGGGQLEKLCTIVHRGG